MLRPNRNATARASSLEGGVKPFVESQFILSGDESCFNERSEKKVALEISSGVPAASVRFYRGGMCKDVASTILGIALLALHI